MERLALTFVALKTSFIPLEIFYIAFGRVFGNYIGEEISKHFTMQMIIYR